MSLVKKSVASGLLVAAICMCAQGALAQAPPVRIAILNFGSTAVGQRASNLLRRQLSKATNFSVLDADQAKAAAAGAGYGGSLNLSVPEARDLGAAIGCDFFLIGDADTLRRSPSDAPIFFESYASIFIVSGRTGRLVRWLGPTTSSAKAPDAERALMDLLSLAATTSTMTSAIHDGIESERAERAARVENAPPVIEVMSDDVAENGSTRAPRPFRRVKPEYTEAAAHLRVEAIVDVLADIDDKGEVNHIEIARWAGYGLDESVLATVKQMHFFPAMRDGRAIPMRVLLRYNFRKPAQ